MKYSPSEMMALFDARSLRERALVAATLLFLTWAIWDSTLGSLVSTEKVTVINQVEQLKRDLQLQNDERRRLLADDSSSQRSALEQQKLRLEASIQLHQQKLDELLAQFVSPQEVPQLLEDVLENHQGLQLMRLSSQPAQPMLLGSQDQPHESVTVYRHPVQIQFKGGYLDVVAYLQALENGPWSLAWRRLEYAVLEHPNAEVMIEIETLSREQEWLGV